MVSNTFLEKKTNNSCSSWDNIL